MNCNKLTPVNSYRYIAQNSTMTAQKSIQEVAKKLSHFICNKHMTPANLAQNISTAVLTTENPARKINNKKHWCKYK